MNNDNEFLTTQFPGKNGSDIHQYDEEKELVQLISTSLTVNMPLRKSTKEIASACAKKIIEKQNDVWEWNCIFYGALNELVELKEIKDADGKTEDYQERQPKAWHLAKEAIRLWKESNYGANRFPKEAQAKTNTNDMQSNDEPSDP